MTTIGIPVPPGFTISTEACKAYYAGGHKLPDGLDQELRDAMREVERVVGKKFGDPENPLLVSVRSGARVSMPGMMDTVLNLGLNEKTLAGLVQKSGDARFGWDSYRRFIMMYGDVVLGLKPDAATEKDLFEEALAEKKAARGVRLDSELDADALKDLAHQFKALIKKHTGRDFPEDPWEQLHGAIGAVFRSWDNQRARTYRKLNNIPAEWGTAVSVCTMVFGNLGDTSATGVAFTRDPNTGEKRFFGEYLINAQGEDVVAGIRTPQPINKSSGGDVSASLEAKMPKLYAELDTIRTRLETHYRDMQDIEFTIEQGRLWLLQTRGGKRSATAAVKIAVDMVKEGAIDEKIALTRVTPAQIDALLHPMVDPTSKRTILAKGLPASPGAATGKVVLTADDAETAGKKGQAVILVRTETSPEDVHGLHYAKGVLTSRGGMTSHAAVVARGMGRPCVVGAGELVIDYQKRTITAHGKTIKEGEEITVDGTTGEVLLGAVRTIQAAGSEEYNSLMGWADKVRRLKVRANADTPKDAEVARKHGAEGIGLCRTEHMFFEPSRILAVREMICADDQAGRRAALAKILPMQRADFEGIFKAMDGLPVTIRLLDPPLHEFLPTEPADIAAVAKELKRDPEVVRARVVQLHEFNPMLGLRGCRLGIVHPEIYEMQVRAIVEAAANVTKAGVVVKPEIMIPLVGAPEELDRLRKMTVEIADGVLKESGAKVAYTVGTMIEVPRAALLADKVAQYADFFSFGTNDLTQMTFGLSRDDAGSFLPKYVELGVLPDEPFTVLDQEGVGMLVKWAVERGRSAKPGLKVGICGEHGGEPRSVMFCDAAGLDYVSCSPFRVPIARLAAAQSVLQSGSKS